ncbi:MAG: cytochrome ubiquinol oxidase subunit I, partial [Lysobacterales bacterium]
KDRVSNRMHLTAFALVAVATTLSAFWILILNSWMQTPQGHEIVDGKFYAVDWFAIIFNPSFPYRFTHMLVASLLTTAFLLAGLSASRMLRNVHGPGTERVLRTGVLLAAALTPLQVVLGDLHGLNTLEHQPAKIAAIEGIWQTQAGAPLTLLGIPDEEQGRTRFAVEIPRAASLILTHSGDGVLQGLEEFPEHPPVLPVFVSFRVMVGIGVAMLFVSWLCAAYLLRGRDLPPVALRALAWLTFSGWVAVLAGWYVTEIGRQPWIVYGELAVADVVADHSQGVMRGTLLAYALLYAGLLAAYVATLRHLSAKPAASLQMRAAEGALGGGR